MPELLPFPNPSNAQDILYHDPSWIFMISDFYGFKPLTYQLEDGRYLPLGLIDDVVGTRIVGFPFSDHISIPNKADIKNLVNICRREFPNHCLKIDFITDAILERELIFKKNFSINLKAKIGSSASFKNMVRRAEKLELSAEKSSSLLSLKSFYKLHSSLRRNKFKVLPQPWKYFEKLYDVFISKGRGYIAEVKDSNSKTVAAAVVLTTSARTYYKYSASSIATSKVGANNLLISFITDQAIDSGHDFVDLGLCSVGAADNGLRRFKESCGAIAENIYTMNTTEPANSRIKTLISNISDATVKGDAKYAETQAISSIIYPLFA